MSTAITTDNIPEYDPPDHASAPAGRDMRPATLTADGLCRLLRLGPTAVPELARSGDLDVSLPPANGGYCPQLVDVRIVRIRRRLLSDTDRLAKLRVEHPPETCNRHLHRALALGGVLRVLGR